MINVSLAIHEDIVLSSVAGIFDMLENVNELYVSEGRPPVFNLEVVSENPKNISLKVPAQLLSHKTFEAVESTDLIIVPAFKPDSRLILQKHKALTNWITKMHAQGVEIASVCVGSFFLAEAGLLDGREATSHWMVMDELQRTYPQIKIRSDRVITDQGGIYTSGGAFSSLKLMLYLISKYCNRETAIMISKRFSIDFDLLSQAHFAVFSRLYEHNNKEILKVQRFIEQNYASHISVTQMAAHVSLGQRSFLRKFKTATNHTPLEYLQRVRIEAAKKSLEEEEKSLEKILTAIGYNDLKSFRTIFKRITGLSPRDYRKKYSKFVLV